MTKEEEKKKKDAQKKAMLALKEKKELAKLTQETIYKNGKANH